MLEEKELDIAPACFAITQARSTAVNFLPTIGKDFSKLYLKNPADSLNWKAYFVPLQPLGWLGIFFFIVAVPPMLAGILFYGKL